MAQEITHRWVRAVEQRAFSQFGSARRFYTNDEAKQILRNTTLLNFMTENDGYIDHVVDNLWPKTDRYNELDLKRFVFLDYPLIAAEAAFSPQHIPALRNITSGLFPFSFGRELNASVTLSPANEEVIFFSERLFSCLSDFFHREANMHPPGTPHGGTPSDTQLRQKRQLEDEVAWHLSRSAYFDFDMSQYATDALPTNSARVFLLLMLMFIWGHELGHIFLGHLDRRKLRKIPESKVTSETLEFTKTQTQELDADMFGSDLYFAYVERGIISKRDPVIMEIQRLLINQLFRFMVKAEVLNGTEANFASSHPPSGLRILYILLRHRALLCQYDAMRQLVEYAEEQIRLGQMPSFDYDKKVVPDGMLIYGPTAGPD
jgi:hypothetical protein